MSLLSILWVIVCQNLWPCICKVCKIVLPPNHKTSKWQSVIKFQWCCTLNPQNASQEARNDNDGIREDTIWEAICVQMQGCFCLFTWLCRGLPNSPGVHQSCEAVIAFAIKAWRSQVQSYYKLMWCGAKALWRKFWAVNVGMQGKWKETISTVIAGTSWGDIPATGSMQRQPRHMQVRGRMPTPRLGEQLS